MKFKRHWAQGYGRFNHRLLIWLSTLLLLAAVEAAVRAAAAALVVIEAQ
jgi:hypothetical protein